MRRIARKRQIVRLKVISIAGFFICVKNKTVDMEKTGHLVFFVLAGLMFIGADLMDFDTGALVCAPIRAAISVRPVDFTIICTRS